ncbi:helix-turn-helix transcriptional regulator [Candidatus Pacearchaeota archaeon]|nr:helix-turn-helix transcriptional regulator [Candidatus Pacearchaeota archaeon]
MNKKEIKKLREKLNMSQEKFAALLGVTRLTVIHWENGIYKPSPLALEKLKDEKEKQL